MRHEVPIQYDSLFEFLEDYRSSISQMQYTVPTRVPFNMGDEVAVQFTVPVLGEEITAHGRVVEPMEGMASLELDPDEGDGIPRLEGFYRFVGALVEEMLVSGRFKVTGQWSDAAAAAAAAGAAAIGSQAAAAGSGGGSAARPSDKLDQLGPATSHGSLDEEEITELLMRLYRERATGVLQIRSETGRRIGWMKKGGFVQWSADPVIEDECLGVLLTQAGKLSSDQLKDSLRQMNETGQKQGECLVEMGALTFPQLVMSLMTQTEIVTRNVFGLREGSWSWHPMDRLGADFVTPPMKTPGFLFAYYKRKVTQLTPSQLDKMQAPIMDQYTQLAEEVNWDDMRMKKVELGLVEILRKKSYRYRSIFTVSNMGRNQTVPILLSLVQLGVLEFVAAEDTAQVEERWRKQLDTKLGHQNDQDPFEVLEVHWTSGTEKVKVSYERMKKEYQNFARGKDLPSDVEGMRTQILENIEVAFVAVKDKAARQATRKKHYEPQQHDFSADLLFRQGEMLLVRHKYAEAIDDFERAVELMPGVAKYKQMLQKAHAKARGGE